MAARPAGWHREEIKAALRQRHGAITLLSRAWGYSPAAISQALARADYSIRLERRIAQALGTTPNLLWPERWTPDGTPRPRTIKADRSPAAPALHRKSVEAA